MKTIQIEMNNIDTQSKFTKEAYASERSYDAFDAALYGTLNVLQNVMGALESVKLNNLVASSDVNKVDNISLTISVNDRVDLALVADILASMQIENTITLLNE